MKPPAFSHSSPSGAPVRKPHAFSLVELIIAMAILSLISILLLTLTDGVMKVWNQGNRRVEVYQSGRAILEIIAREVSVATTMPGSKLETTQHGNDLNSYAAYPMVINPPLPSTANLLLDPTGQPMDRLAFFAPGAQFTSGESLSTIAYYVDSDHVLRRLAINPDQYEGGDYREMLASSLTIYGTTNQAARTDRLNQQLRPVSWLNTVTNAPDAFTDPSVTAPLANNILAFLVRSLGADGVPLGTPSSVIPVAAPDYSDGINRARAMSTGWLPLADTPPHQVELVLIMIDSQTVSRLGGMSSIPPFTLPATNEDQDFWTSITNYQQQLIALTPNFAVISKRVTIRGSR